MPAALNARPVVSAIFPPFFRQPLFYNSPVADVGGMSPLWTTPIDDQWQNLFRHRRSRGGKSQCTVAGHSWTGVYSGFSFLRWVVCGSGLAQSKLLGFAENKPQSNSGAI